MNRNSIEGRDTESLREQYIQAATAHGEATAKGDYRKANKHYDTLASIYRELKARGRAAQTVLLDSIHHPNASVRVWIAAHALEFAPDEGEKVLEELARGGGIWQLDAEMTLKEWRQGSLRFP